MGGSGGESSLAAGVDGFATPKPDPPVVARESPVLFPEDIDGCFSPKPRDSAVSCRFDDEILVVDGTTGGIHVLNQVAAVVWECFDGTVSLDELAQELSEAFQVSVETVRADTLAMTRQLGNLELLAGVTPFARKSPRPGLRDVGDRIGPLEVRTSDGVVTTVPRPESNGTLLINWSPTCGYCIKIVGDLERCRSGLTDHGVDLVLLTVGGQEDNLLVLEPAGLGDAAFYRHHSEGVNRELSDEPFGSIGTPVAYLLDAEGRIERPAALGAAEVPSLARRAAGLLIEVSGAPLDLVPSGDSTGERSSRHPELPAAGGMCGPSATGAAKTPRQWASTAAYEIGGYQVGIRANSARTADLLARAFCGYRLAEEAAPAANFSVVLGGDSSSDSKDLSLLLAADTTVVRSRSPRRVLRALQGRLSALLGTDDSLLRINSVAALMDDQALLLPQAAIRWMDYLQPRLARLGLRLSDEPHSLVDFTTGELVIPDPTIELAPDVLVELDELRSSRSELPPMEPGRYRLGACAVEQDPAQPADQLTRAGAVAALLPAVEGSPDQVRELIAAVGQLAERTRMVALRSTSRQELIQSIEEGFGFAARGTR